MLKAHRVAYAYANGILPGTLLVCHTCDNRLCVRPDHLFLGTTQDNAKDMTKKGRGYFNRPESRLTRVAPDKHWCHLNPERQRGANNHNARLAHEQVEAIRSRYGRREASQAKLAAEYGVAQTTISAIIRRKNWRD